MKLVTKQTDYAVRALLHLARAEGQYVSARVLAQQERIPLAFLRRILQTLAGAGWVTTREGVSGGVRLAVPPARIRLSDVIQLMQGPLQLTECLFRRRLCHNRSQCVLRHRLLRIELLVTREFNRITLHTLLKDMATAHETTDHKN